MCDCKENLLDLSSLKIYTLMATYKSIKKVLRHTLIISKKGQWFWGYLWGYLFARISRRG